MILIEYVKKYIFILFLFVKFIKIKYTIFLL